MGGRKKKGSRFGKYLTFSTASGSGDSNDPPEGLASIQSDPDPQPSGEQNLQQAALSPPTTGRSNRLLNKLKWRSPSPSPSPSQLPPEVKSTPDPDMVWAKALDIAKKKLSDNNLPPLDLTNLTSQSTEENIEAVVKALNTAQEGDKKERWSYTWRGKEVIVVERLGKILKSVEKYTKVVDNTIQSNPQVSALVWAGVWAIMRVSIDALSWISTHLN